MAEELVVRTALGGGVEELRLNEPESRNAMSEQMADRFFAVVGQIIRDASVRVVILTGAGKAFSGGGHLQMLQEKTKLNVERNRELMEQFYERFLVVRKIPVPVIAAINGHAMGAALCLALACDLRVAVKEAKLGLNFVHLGLHPGMGATYLVPRLVGPARAAELLYGGKVLSAEEAERCGLVNEVCEASDFRARVDAIAAGIAQAGPQAVRALKQSLTAGDDDPLQRALKREAQCQSLDYVGPEFLEGITAALEKRAPKF